ncbi:hypothetical protein LZ30DRAFT_423823 [Colletotrichum cereale]|nr:hypothetical protein LZ30DRAFT_423823 [Colletotrichum cereale]
MSTLAVKAGLGGRRSSRLVCKCQYCTPLHLWASPVGITHGPASASCIPLQHSTLFRGCYWCLSGACVQGSSLDVRLSRLSRASPVERPSRSLEGLRSLGRHSGLFCGLKGPPKHPRNERRGGLASWRLGCTGKKEEINQWPCRCCGRGRHSWLLPSTFVTPSLAGMSQASSEAGGDGRRPPASLVPPTHGRLVAGQLPTALQSGSGICASASRPGWNDSRCRACLVRIIRSDRGCLGRDLSVRVCV